MVLLARALAKNRDNVHGTISIFRCPSISDRYLSYPFLSNNDIRRSVYANLMPTGFSNKERAGIYLV